MWTQLLVLPVATWVRFIVSYKAVKRGFKTRIRFLQSQSRLCSSLLAKIPEVPGFKKGHMNTGTTGLFGRQWVHLESQTYTFSSPVCVFMCSSKYCFMLKSLPHHWHMNCLCPMWMLMWERSWYLYWNRSSQFYRDNRGIQITCTHQVSTQAGAQQHSHVCGHTPVPIGWKCFF